MEAIPLCKRVGRMRLRGLVPREHVVAVVDTDALAKRANHLGRRVEQVVGVEDDDVSSAVLVQRGLPLLGSVTPSNSRADEPLCAQIVEEGAQLHVAGLVGAEVVEAGLGGERRDRTAVVRRDAVAGVADEEGEVELREQRCGHNGRIVLLALLLM